jgi:hypothetical protein
VKTLLDLVHNLLGLERLSRQAVADATNLELERDEVSSSENFDVFFGYRDLESHELEIELRVPGPNARPRDGLLIMNLDPGLSVAHKEIVERFGAPSEFTLRPPNAPKDGPTFNIHRLPGGKLSFGLVDRPPCEELTAIVIDRTDA